MVKISIGGESRELDPVATLTQRVGAEPLSTLIDLDIPGLDDESGQVTADLIAFGKSGWATVEANKIADPTAETESTDESFGGSFLVFDISEQRVAAITPRVVVKFRDTGFALQDEVEEVRQLDFCDGLFEARLKSPLRLAEIARMLERIEGRDEVEWIEPVLLEHFERRCEVSVLDNMSADVRWPFDSLGLAKAWQVACGSGVVAVLDLGFYTGHPALVFNDQSAFFRSGELVVDLNRMPNDWHGTACAGILAARPNREEMRGVAFCADILGIALEDAITSQLELARAFAHAADAGASVVSCSLGPIRRPNRVLTKVLEASLDHLKDGRNGLGVPVFWATSRKGDTVLDRPLDHELVVGVGAVNRAGGKIGGFGKNLDLLAPGAYVWSTGYSQSRLYYAAAGGPSFAAPAIAGIAALMLQIDNTLTSKSVIDFLLDSGDEGARTKNRGYGVPDADCALRLSDC